MSVLDPETTVFSDRTSSGGQSFDRSHRSYGRVDAADAHNRKKIDGRYGVTPRPESDGAVGEAARARLTSALNGTAARDRRAFALVYQLTSAKLFGICLRICGERRAAEDVLQEVYLTVWTRAAAFSTSRGSAIAWLSAIARNRAIDWRRGNRPVMAAATEEAELVPDPAPAAPDLLLLDEEEQRLHRCLDELDPHQRAAIRSAFFDGLTYAELAERQGVPLGTMKSWVRRGLMRMRTALDNDG